LSLVKKKQQAELQTKYCAEIYANAAHVDLFQSKAGVRIVKISVTDSRVSISKFVIGYF